MKVIFYGSLDPTRPDYSQIESNLALLVKHMARKRVAFLVRCVTPSTNSPTVPIDNIVIKALEDVNSKGQKVDLTVLYEPADPKSTSWGLPVKSYTASTSNRVQFYSDLLKIVDIVIGVGGELGLVRLAISCEWTRHPFFMLPGSGGTTELLWSEMFVKSFQVKSFTENSLERLHQMPYVNHVDRNYASGAFDTIEFFLEQAMKQGIGGVSPTAETIKLGGITIRTTAQVCQRISAEVWLALVSVTASIISLIYFLGTKNAVWRLLHFWGLK